MAESKTREQVRELTDMERSPREIALRLGISTQRVYQHLKAIQKADEKRAAEEASA